MADGFAEVTAPFPEDEELAQGEDDKALLREVLDRQDSATDEFAAFEDMLEALRERRFKRLTPKQRTWLEGAADRLGIVFRARDDDERLYGAANVPRGREVETPAALRDLPKRPPGRRSPAGLFAGGDDQEWE